MLKCFERVFDHFLYTRSLKVNDEKIMIEMCNNYCINFVETMSGAA